MIYRIASILYGGNLADCHFPEYFRRKARQVLEAMKEPTPAMVKAEPPLNYLDYVGTCEYCQDCGQWEIAKTWPAMIQAALDESPESPKMGA